MDKKTRDAVDEMTKGTSWEGVSEGDLLEYRGDVCVLQGFFVRNPRLGGDLWVCPDSGRCQPEKIQLAALMEFRHIPVKEADPRFNDMARILVRQMADLLPR